MEDERILCSSQLYTKLIAGKTLINPQKVMSDETFLRLPLGDTQTSWLIKPNPNNIHI